MSSRRIILYGIIATLSILLIASISIGYGANNYLFQDGSTPLTANWDINGYYILEFPMESWIHIDLQQGVTDVHVSSIPSGIHHQDRRYLALHVSVDIPPGVGKTLEVIISDGTDSLTVLLTGDVDVFGYDDSTPFTLDVSAETLSLEYSQTAGGGASSGCIMLHWYYVVNE